MLTTRAANRDKVSFLNIDLRLDLLDDDRDDDRRAHFVVKHQRPPLNHHLHKNRS